MPRVRSMSFLNIFYFLTVYLFFFLLKSPEYATQHITNALSLCFTRVIPSLFPFLVLNELIVSTGLAERIGKFFGTPLSKIFKIQKESAAAFISGCLFGFPLGTKTAVSLYENGYVSKEESERLICFCSNTGPSFIVGVIGSSLGNRNIAVCIYISQIISAFFIGLFLRKNDGFVQVKNKTLKKTFSLTQLPKNVTSSVLPMLNICAFVCFFSCISASVEKIFDFFKLSGYVSLFSSGFLELTNGIAMTADFKLNFASVFLCSFFVGWSGVSVVLQSISITSQYGLNSKKFVFSKFIQGVLCAVICIILCKIFKLY